MVTDEEKRIQFKWRSIVAGRSIEVIARHYRRNRMPRAHEVALALRKGRPAALVEEIEHEWIVLYNGQRVACLRLTPGGDVTSGRRVFPRCSVVNAAQTLVLEGVDRG